jgi:Uma2 family endonuclease
MPRVLASSKQMTFEEYLEFEEKALVKHEFVDGYAFVKDPDESQLQAMAGGTDYHNTIALNIAAKAKAATRGTPCRVFASDVKIRTPDDIGYYPDVFVTCSEENDGSRVKRFPCLLVEVLSDSTGDIDRGEKWQNYRKVNSLEAYILVSQKQRFVEIYRRMEGGSWRYEVLENEGSLDLPCINTAITLDEVYEDIDFSKSQQPL